MSPHIGSLTTNLFPTAEKLMNLLKGSPEVKVILEREKKAEAEAAKQARIECLTRVRALEARQSESQKALDAAMSGVRAAELKVNELKTNAATAAAAHAEAGRQFGLAVTELNQVHGEGDLQKTLYRLDRAIVKTGEQIGNLDALKNSRYFDEKGLPVFRFIPPDTAKRHEVLKRNLEALKKLQSVALDLVFSPKAPSEIYSCCEAICKAIGQPLQPTPSTTKDE